MPETFDLDRAFEALAHDVMDRATPPSARSAIKQARRRRRTTIATVALAAAVVVGGVAVPTLLLERSGVEFAHGMPIAAPLDADAMELATEGWISGWSDEVGSGWSEPECFGSRAASGPPDALERGTSRLSGYEESTALPLFLTYGDATSAEAAWQALNAPLLACPESVTETDAPTYPAGTEVRHYTVQYSTDGSLSAVVTDVWIARTGNAVGSLDVRTRAGIAAPATIDAVSDALVAGMLAGWSQDLEHPQEMPEVTSRPQLPGFDERDLIAALDGWRGAERPGGVLLPQVPCIPGGRGSAAEESGTRDGGRAYEIKGYLEPGPEAAAWMQKAAAQLRDCDVTTMNETALADGVTLFTFELAVDAGHGAIWLAANEDRNIVYTVNGAATPLPVGIGERVGQELTRALAVHWGPAE